MIHSFPGTLRAVFGVLALLLVAACGSPSAPTATPPPEGVTIIEPPQPIDDFVLMSKDAAPIHYTDLKGKYTLLAFGFTHCPDICPITLAHFKAVRGLLADKADLLNVVFISVDGARDTPQRLKEYIAVFDTAIVGMTGDEPTVRAVIGKWGGTFVLENAGGLKKDYTVQHTAASFLMDTQGRWIRKFAYGTEPQLLAAEIRKLLG